MDLDKVLEILLLKAIEIAKRRKVSENKTI